VSRGIALLFLNPGARWEWVINATLRPLHTRERDPVPIVQEAAWATRTVWPRVENLAPTVIRSPDPPARSDSIYRLSYSGPNDLFSSLLFSFLFSHFPTSTLHALSPLPCVLISATNYLLNRTNNVVKVLRYKSEGRWFDSRWCHWNFSLT
jgi:hypothetical protein